MSDLLELIDRLEHVFHEDEPSPLMQPEEDDHIRDDVLALCTAARRAIPPDEVAAKAESVGTHAIALSDSGRCAVVPLKRWNEAKALAFWIASLTPEATRGT